MKETDNSAVLNSTVKTSNCRYIATERYMGRAIERKTQKEREGERQRGREAERR